jgi:hypothetical protein
MSYPPQRLALARLQKSRAAGSSEPQSSSHASRGHGSVYTEGQLRQQALVIVLCLSTSRFAMPRCTGCDPVCPNDLHAYKKNPAPRQAGHCTTPCSHPRPPSAPSAPGSSPGLARARHTAPLPSAVSAPHSPSRRSLRPHHRRQSTTPASCGRPNRRGTSQRLSTRHLGAR